jgi:DNA-binding IclR family transcriptional regulator
VTERAKTSREPNRLVAESQLTNAPASSTDDEFKLSGIRSDRRTLVPAIGRAVAVLDAIMENHGEALSLAELARQLQVPKSSLANICREMVAERLLQRIGNSYRLGPKLAILGAVFLSSVDLVREFQDACLAHLPPIGQTVKLSVLGDHGDTIYLSRYDSTGPANLVFDFGVQQPAHCTSSGKAMLACLPEDEFEKWTKERRTLTRSTHNSIGTLDALRAELEKIRSSGVSFDAEECHVGVFCVGTALANTADSSDLLGLSFVMLSQHATEDMVARISDEVRKLAKELSVRLGGSYLTLPQLMTIERQQPSRPDAARPNRSARSTRPLGARAAKAIS